MNELQTGSAATAGLSLVGRNPGAVAIWGGILFGLAIIPFLIGLPAIVGAIRDPASATGAAENLNSNALYQVVNVAFTLIGSVFLQTAVFRSVLRPEERGFAYLRFGRAELLTFAWLLILVLAAVVVLFAFGVVLGLVSFAFGGDASPIATGLGMVLGFLVAIPVAIWLGLRLSQVGPSIVATGRLDIAAAWALTRGRAGSLFVTWLINLLVLIAILIGIFIAMMLVFVVIGGIVGISFGASLGGQGSGPDPGTTLAVGVVLVLLGLVAFALYFWVVAAVQAIAVAPWADVYKQLTHRDVAQTFA